MADCFSLPNAAEMVEETRLSAEYIARLNGGEAKDYIPWKAADAIEQLLAENAKLKAERDAAVEEIPKHCGTCKRFVSGEPCLNDANSCGWKWRGVKEEEEDAADNARVEG